MSWFYLFCRKVDSSAIWGRLSAAAAEEEQEEQEEEQEVQGEEEQGTGLETEAVFPTTRPHMPPNPPPH